MNSSTPWILIAVAVLIVVLGIVAIFIKKKYKTPTDYYALFMIGLIWIIFGAFSFFRYKDYSFNGLFAIGIIFLMVGLVNKDKWKANHRTWNQLSPAEKKWKHIIIGILGFLVLAGLVVYLLTERGII